MTLQFTYTYDGENDLYKIQYKGNKNLQLVVISGSSMKELAKCTKLTVEKENDMVAAVAEYFILKKIISTEENPIFILPESDIYNVKNSIPVSQELLKICENYLNE